MTSASQGTLVPLFGGVFALLVLATAIGTALDRSVTNERYRARVENINSRVRAWWVMAMVFMASVATGASGSVLLFSLVSLLALREFMTLAPTAPADHRALFWCFFIAVPLEYTLVWMRWYGLFTILIPVYFSIFIVIRAVLAGDTTRFVERAATMQWGLVICVYFVSYVPALMMLRIPGYEHRNGGCCSFSCWSCS